METILKVILAVGGVLLAVALVNIICAAVMYAGWNWGLVGAVTFVNSISFGQAFWLSLLPASIVVSVKRSNG